MSIKASHLTTRFARPQVNATALCGRETASLARPAIVTERRWAGCAVARCRLRVGSFERGDYNETCPSSAGSLVLQSRFCIGIMILRISTRSTASTGLASRSARGWSEAFSGAGAGARTRVAVAAPR